MKMVKIWKAEKKYMRDSCEGTVAKEMAFNTREGDWGQRLEEID